MSVNISVGEREEEEGSRKESLTCPLSEFNPALSGTRALFQAHYSLLGTSPAPQDGQSVNKRRFLFCKCASGNRSSCCSCPRIFQLYLYPTPLLSLILHFFTHSYRAVSSVSHFNQNSQKV